MRAAPVTAEKFKEIAASPLPFVASYGGERFRPRPSWCAAFWLAMHARSTRCSTICLRSSSPAKPPPVSPPGGRIHPPRLARDREQARRYENVLARLPRAHVHRSGAPRSRIAAAFCRRDGWRIARSFRRQGAASISTERRRAPGRIHHWRTMLAITVGAGRALPDLVGMPPMHYLASWRMQIAAGC